MSIENVSAIHQYRVMIEEIHKEIESLEGNLLPVRNQKPRGETDLPKHGIELLGELQGVINRLRALNEEVVF